MWVGGQLVLAALLPVLRGLGPDVAPAVARRFSAIAWPFFALAVFTGIWNLLEVDIGDRPTSYHVALGVKILLVAVSGLAAVLHANTPTTIVKAITGGLSLVAALGALWLGVDLVT